jgi:hypothetical protein
VIGEILQRFSCPSDTESAPIKPTNQKRPQVEKCCIIKKKKKKKKKKKSRKKKKKTKTEKQLLFTRTDWWQSTKSTLKNTFSNEVLFAASEI